MAESIIKVENLVKSFGDHEVLKKIDFEILGTGFSIWKTVDIPKDCFSKEEPGKKLISFIDNSIEYITKNLDLSQMRDFYYGI